MTSGKILAVCKSDAKGIQKKDVGRGVFVQGKGLEGDVHSEGGLRQVSLLSREHVDAFCQKKGIKGLAYGAFAENLLTEGVLLDQVSVGMLFKVGAQVQLRVTQIGKSCHSGCAIFKQVGDCLMPRQGIFVEVVEGGPVQVGDNIRMIASE